MDSILRQYGEAIVKAWHEGNVSSITEFFHDGDDYIYEYNNRTAGGHHR